MRVMNTTGSDTEFNGAVTAWKTDLQRYMFGAMFQRIQYWTVELSIVEQHGVRLPYQFMTLIASDDFCCRVHGGYITLAVNGNDAIGSVFNNQIVKCPRFTQCLGEVVNTLTDLPHFTGQLW